MTARGNTRSRIYLDDDNHRTLLKRLGDVYQRHHWRMNNHCHKDDRGRLQEVPRAQRRPYPKPLAYYANPRRDPKAAMASAYASGGYTLAQIAAHFGVHYRTVSRAVGQRG